LYELATGLPPFSSKKKQTLKVYMDEIERQNVDLAKMLDPKARWSRTRASPGLDLLSVAKLATTINYKLRPTTTEITGLLNRLADKVDVK
jgi:hypothetical protein